MKKYSALLLSLALVFFLTAALRGQEETKYTNESFARVSYISGKVFIQRAPDAKPEEAVLNAPLEDGNKVLTNDGRAEVYFGKSNYARLNDNSALEIITLPKKDVNQVRLRVLNGSVYVSVNNLDQEKSIEVHTPDASFYVLDEGLYRVDVRENKKTDMLVFHGVIEAAGESGSQLLRSEQSLEASQGRFTSGPRRFFAVAEDSFDRWNQSRESKLGAYMAKGNLPEELRDFEGELDEYGDWIYLRPYGWVWAPNNVGDDWRPYYNGSWTWLTLGGWTWVPYEPWGWAPFHYGRWGWGAGLGWYWIPTSIWGPAWVSWWWGPDYWAWAPMSWWGYPGVLFDGFFYDHWTGYYPGHSRALTVIHKDQLRAHNISAVALRSRDIRGLDKMTLSARTPSLRPAERRLSAESLGGGKVFPRRESVGTAGALTGVNRGLRGSSLRDPGRVNPPGSVGRSGQTGLTNGVRRNGFGYPSSPSISIKRLGGSSSNSIRSRFYNYLRGDRSASRGSSSWSRGSNSSRGSSASRSRGSVSSGRSSGSRSSGSRGSYGGSRGGSVSRGGSGGGRRH